MDLQAVKQRFGIIGNAPLLNAALQTAVKVAPTDMNVLIQGESGVGKESFSKIIHHLSGRKHAPFIAVNCGAIPEGTIDSELFGHEKGSFTGATDKRQGYFESVNGGTIFLDEVGELPLGTQARLLRILENGEFIKVGSSKVQKTDVRVVAASNRNLLDRAQQGKFREDLYYRLATVPIRVPRLSERKEDISLLFKKFSSDFSENHHRELLELSREAQILLENYPWPGNIRQLKNISEQICVLENRSWITDETLKQYLPPVVNQLPMLLEKTAEGNYEGMSERDIFYKVLIDLRRDVNDLKKVVFGLLDAQDGQQVPVSSANKQDIGGFRKFPLHEESRFLQPPAHSPSDLTTYPKSRTEDGDFIDAETLGTDDTNDLSLETKEIELIRLALTRNNGKRKKAADDLGISERTLYRKIKQYELE
jgi:DNA-binding NtrC family response regulator